ncbi:MAG: glutamate 5-kinase [Leptonema sp. (in: Bacteria)]|nr:glutamate 5-kinase [Leptonema sp. (in: bacteria)]
MNNSNDRELLYNIVLSSKRVVIKVGSNLVAPATSNGEPSGIDRTMINKLCNQILFLKQKGIEVILVSSGAVSMGRAVLSKTQLTYQPITKPGISRKQALAAIGQARLISFYGEIFNTSNLAVSQVLLTARDFRDRSAYLNIGHTIEELLRMGVVPIINENDTVSTEELRFGDNDLLSAACAGLLRSDLLILLTSIDGFLIDNQRISALTVIDRNTMSKAGGPSGGGSGGMRTKLRAGQLGLRTGFRVAILPGRHKAPVESLFAGEDIGTLIGSNQTTSLNARKQWLLFVRSKGSLVIDDGAVDALLNNHSSLLWAGIQKVNGVFSQSEVVEILNSNHQSIGRGIVRAGSKEIESSIKQKLPLHFEIIHRNDLITEDSYD